MTEMWLSEDSVYFSGVHSVLSYMDCMQTAGKVLVPRGRACMIKPCWIPAGHAAGSSLAMSPLFVRTPPCCNRMQSSTPAACCRSCGRGQCMRQCCKAPNAQSVWCQTSDNSSKMQRSTEGVEGQQAACTLYSISTSKDIISNRLYSLPK